MTDKKHTAEPWQIAYEDLSIYIEDKETGLNQVVCFKFGKDDEKDEANAARIVECVNALAGIDNPIEWVRMVREVKQELSFYKPRCEALGKSYVALIEEKEALQAENERLKKEIAEWELSIKAAKESIEGRNDVIKALDSKNARIRTFALKALETIKVTAEAEEDFKGYNLKHLIGLCDMFKKAIKEEK